MNNQLDHPSDRSVTPDTAAPGEVIEGKEREPETPLDRLCRDAIDLAVSAPVGQNGYEAELQSTDPNLDPSKVTLWRFDRQTSSLSVPGERLVTVELPLRAAEVQARQARASHAVATDSVMVVTLHQGPNGHVEGGKHIVPRAGYKDARDLGGQPAEELTPDDLDWVNNRLRTSFRAEDDETAPALEAETSATAASNLKETLVGKLSERGRVIHTTVVAEALNPNIRNLRIGRGTVSFEVCDREGNVRGARKYELSQTDPAHPEDTFVDGEEVSADGRVRRLMTAVPEAGESQVSPTELRPLRLVPARELKEVADIVASARLVIEDGLFTVDARGPWTSIERGGGKRHRPARDLGGRAIAA